jgi:polyhydroxybutyrate depolymerase
MKSQTLSGGPQTRRAFLQAFAALAFTPTLVSAAAPAQMPAGTTREVLQSGGLKRTYLLHKPPKLKPDERVPLVIMFHGGSGTAAQLYEQRCGLSGKADQVRFIVAYPDAGAKPDKTIWSAHMNVAGADTGFVRELIQHLCAKQPVDPRRVYLCGFSSGALLTQRLGTELADQIAAVGVVSGSFYWRLGSGPAPLPPTPARPLPVIIIHGRLDKNVPYDGATNERVTGWPVAQAVDFWVRADGCNPAPQQKTTADGNVVTATYTGGKEGSEVVFHTINNGGHAWPHGGATGLDANDVLWDFFSRHPRP